MVIKMLLGKHKKNQKITYEKIDCYQNIPVFIIHPDDSSLWNDFIGEKLIIDNHWHRSIEIIYTNQSDGYLVLNGNKEYLPIDSLRIINCKDIHYLEETDPSKKYTGYAIQISYQYLLDKYPDFDHLYFEMKEEYKEEALIILKSLIQLYQTDHQRNKEVITLLVDTLMAYFVTNFSKNRLNDKKIKNEKLCKVMEYLEVNYNQELDLKEVAHQFDISYAYLAKIFNDHLNMSAGQYINKIKFEKALIDISTTNETITDIAYQHGFTSASSFIREFKKIKGVSPKQYRKMLEE